MANKSGVNKSQSIREHLQANPSATPNEIIAALKTQGVTVSHGLVSNVKYTGGKKKTGKRTVLRRKPGAQTADLSTLQAAAKFVATVGDAETAVAAVKQVQSLQIR